MKPLALSCVIPAYNEAPRIRAVLDVALATPEIEEVIVVDDGSTDGTAGIAQALALRHRRLRLHRMAANGGKTRAVAAGVAAARGTLLMLVDADLEGLTADDLSALAAPVIEGPAAASISLRANAPVSWRALGLDYISGERVMPRALLADRLAALDGLPRFGLEVFINDLWLDAGYHISVVRWPAVASPMKHVKRAGRIAGLKGDIAMMRDIFATISPPAALGQILAMRMRRV